MSSPGSRKAVKSDPLAVYGRLTPRDLHLCSLLGEHYLLSTQQITKALFAGPASAKARLRILHQLGVLARFRFSAPQGGTRSYLYTLGPVGLRLNPTRYHDPANPAAKAPRSSLERVHRIAASPVREHLLAVNEFFTDLYAHARTHPQTRLARWWSEQHATAAYATANIRPDGHGVWSIDTASVGMFLEVDRGTEPLAKVLSKLRAYENLAKGGGPRYPVLLWLPGRRRENNLLDLLAGVRTAMPVATGVHGENPAGPVWTLAAQPEHRRALHELPSHHGSDDPVFNPHYFRDARPE